MESPENSTTTAFLQRHSDLYVSAIRAPFILSIRDGSLDPRSYSRWLCQDYLFVKEFCRYLASVLARAPESVIDDDLDTLLGGLSALQQEFLWFRSQSVRWNVSFDGVTIHEATRGYIRFLKDLSGSDVEYPVALAALWAIEMIYNQSFATCLEPDANTPPELLEACQRWGSKEFKGYCSSLQHMADKALAVASDSVRFEAEQKVQEVLRKEVEFWNMSFRNI